MNRVWLISATLIATCILADLTAPAQTATQLRRDRLRGTLDVQRANIAEQRVQRQTEIMRLEGLIRQFSDRMTRLERQMMTVSRLPAISIEEAEAALKFAEAQLQETEFLHSKDQATDVQVARHRLELARAKGQLQTAKAAHADSLIALELNVLYAERYLAEQAQEKDQLERFIAKGYTTSQGLKFLDLDVSVAEKQLQRARLRLEAQRKLSGQSDPIRIVDPEASTDSVPSEASAAEGPSVQPAD